MKLVGMAIAFVAMISAGSVSAQDSNAGADERPDVVESIRVVPTSPPPAAAPLPPPIHIPSVPPPVAVTPPPAPRSLGRAAQPRGLDRWVQRVLENYPARALRQGLEGTVGFRLIVNGMGRVNECILLRSSGHRILDDGACRSLERYARFYPALDEKGNPTLGSWTNVINYSLGPEVTETGDP